MIPYLKNGSGLISRARKYFNDTREPFAITLTGGKLYFIVRELASSFGVSNSALYEFSRQPLGEKDDVVSRKTGIKNPRLKSLSQLNNDFWKQQLLPGERYSELQERFLGYIETSLIQADTSNKSATCEAANHEHTSLMEWTQSVLIDAGVRAFFGDKLLELEPDLPKHFLKFNNEQWKLWHKWPKTTQMRAAKSQCIKTMQQYLALPKHERPGAAYMVEIMETTQRALGIPEDDIAIVLFMLLWTTNTNTYKLLFWALAHLLRDPGLLATIREETAPAIKPGKGVSIPYLTDSCPWLSALLNEVLRIYGDASSTRLVTAPTSIGGKALPVGSCVVVPAQQLHFNRSIYGPDVNEFAPERFIRSKNLTHSSSYRPFGGGISYCPGRLLARQEVSIFIALALARFDVEIVGERKFPVADKGKPTAGVMSPKPGEDLLLRLSPR
ncbi:hypothetical protein EPUS_06339 [Endocarpon pusillum Z07020]|uniref:Cytochrome P450 n=1 Tax=Endocarpon pusillum (strain Z07020 / HMAS-L-300199) TaxID=1263415 RepID=U1GDZ2_ENDPU|nr:uncharacterized protein EPUS_06339 [Endocarpon pusillum Z07020]ERF70298.1 hypothetical protein EPUS_06339 [Endocarpon pusillum Z07020]